MSDSCDVCAICLSVPEEDDRTVIKCGHAFCQNCISAWLRVWPTCPLCRAELESQTSDLLDAIKHNDVDRVRALLMLTDPRAQNQIALKDAVALGRVRIVRMLLNDGRVNPGLHLNTVINMAAQQGDLDMVDLLLRDRRVDPSAAHSHALYAAAESGNERVVDRLLDDGRVSVRDAVQLGREVYSSYNPAAIELIQIRASPDMRVLLDAISNRSRTAVARLLRRIDPSQFNNAALRQAIMADRTKMVYDLLEDPRVSPAENAYELMSLAYGKDDIASYLWEDPRIDKVAVMHRARDQGDRELLSYLGRLYNRMFINRP